MSNDASFISNQLCSLGQELISLNNVITYLSLECSRRINKLQESITMGISYLREDEQGNDCLVPEETLTDFERIQLQGLEATKDAMMTCWKHVEERKREIYREVAKRIHGQQDGGEGQQ